MSQAFEKAKALVAQVPLPDDAEDQLDALYAQADPDELFMFDGLYEAVFVAREGLQSAG